MMDRTNSTNLRRHESDGSYRNTEEDVHDVEIEFQDIEWPNDVKDDLEQWKSYPLKYESGLNNIEQQSIWDQ